MSDNNAQLNAENEEEVIDTEGTGDDADAAPANNEEEEAKDKKPATAVAPAATAAAAAAAPAVDLAEREKALNERETALAAREAAAKQKELDAKALVRRTEFAETAKAFAGDQAAKVTFMESLADKFGEDSPEFMGYVEDQKALGAQIEASSLFDETGKPGAETGIDAAAKLDAMAKERMKTDKISYEKAYGLVSAENKDLAASAINAE